ncbi:unnamed protein product, partial [Linum tenue]
MSESDSGTADGEGKNIQRETNKESHADLYQNQPDGRLGKTATPLPRLSDPDSPNPDLP